MALERFTTRDSSRWPGVYIAFNGRYFVWDNCKKSRALDVFEELE